MQISIYLDDQFIRQVDREARLRNKTRSKLIQSILKSFFKMSDGKKSVWEKAFGMFGHEPHAAEDLIKTIRKNRVNRKWA